MSEVGAYEAKTHLPRLLKRVEAGETVTITRNGRAIACLIPVAGAADAAARILEMRKAVARRPRAKKLSMRDLIEEGRQ